MTVLTVPASDVRPRDVIIRDRSVAGTARRNVQTVALTDTGGVLIWLEDGALLTRRAGDLVKVERA
jgi:hypothetical protein